jgi:hypothetical protein
MIENEKLDGDGNSSKAKLFDVLDYWILRKGLTELHTHLMGMGSADFWVSRIIECYLPRALRERNLKQTKKKHDNEADDVLYPLNVLMEASGFFDTNNPVEKSNFEAFFFDSSGSSLQSAFQLSEKLGLCLSNTTLVGLLNAEETNLIARGMSPRSGPLRALVRNWFEMLGTNGTGVHYSDIMKTCTWTLNDLLIWSYLGFIVVSFRSWKVYSKLLSSTIQC